MNLSQKRENTALILTPSQKYSNTSKCIKLRSHINSTKWKTKMSRKRIICLKMKNFLSLLLSRVNKKKHDRKLLIFPIDTYQWQTSSIKYPKSVPNRANKKCSRMTSKTTISTCLPRNRLRNTRAVTFADTRRALWWPVRPTRLKRNPILLLETLKKRNKSAKF